MRRFIVDGHLVFSSAHAIAKLSFASWECEAHAKQWLTCRACVLLWVRSHAHVRTKGRKICRHKSLHQLASMMRTNAECRSVQAAMQSPCKIMKFKMPARPCVRTLNHDKKKDGQLLRPLLPRERFPDGCDESLHVSWFAKFHEIVKLPTSYTNRRLKMENHAAESSYCSSLCALTSPLQRLCDQGWDVDVAHGSLQRSDTVSLHVHACF